MSASTPSEQFPRALLAVQAGAALLCAAWIGASAFTAGGHTCFSLFDDAMISMTYARNIAHGHGFTWFPGYVPVEGYTNLLWMLFMAGVHLLPLPPGLTSLPVMLAGMFLLLVQNHLVWRLTECLARGDDRLRSAPLHACVLNAFCYSQLFWTLRGMEVALVSVLVLLAVRDALRVAEGGGVTVLPALWLSLANLTRPDAIVPALAVIGWLMLLPGLRGCRRSALLALLSVVVTWLALTAFRLRVFGEALPNTYYLKLEGVPTLFRIREGLGKVLKTIGECLYPVVLLLLPPMVMIPWKRDAWRSGSLLCGVGLSMWAYSAYTGGDAWDTETFANRFLTTGLAPLLCIAGCGPPLLRLAIDRLPEPWRRLVVYTILVLPALLLRETWSFFQLTDLAAYPTFTGLLFALGPSLLAGALLAALLRAPAPARLVPWALLVAAWLGMNLGSWVSVSRNGTSHFADDVKWSRLGMAFREASPVDTRFALTWAGAFPYFSERPCIDMLGKCDPVVAHGPPRIAEVGLFPGHMKWNYRHSIGELGPDVIAGLWYRDDVLGEVLEAGGYDEVDGSWYRRGIWTGMSSEEIRAVLRRAEEQRHPSAASFP